MTSSRTILTTAGFSLLSVALVAFGASCAPDSSIGPDTVAGAGSPATTAQGGASSGGSGPAASGGAVTQPATGGSAPASGTGGTAPAAGGSTSSGGTTPSTGGTTAAAGGDPVGTAGATGGGTVGAGGPSLCPIAGTTLCDGFEGSAPGAADSPFSVLTAKGDTMVVDTTKFYRGSKAMKFSGLSETFIVASKIFSGTTKATNNNIWGRYFIFSNLANAAAAPAGHVVYGALADSANSGNQFHFVGGSRGKLQAEIRNTADAYTDNMKAPAAADPGFPTLADGWQCWEWHVTDTDDYDFYINGVEVTEMKITAGKAVMSKDSFQPIPLFGGLYIGWQNFSPTTAPISGWIDEVAVGPNRIPCGT